jgi:hypothetical protein
MLDSLASSVWCPYSISVFFSGAQEGRPHEEGSKHDMRLVGIERAG